MAKAVYYFSIMVDNAPTILDAGYADFICSGVSINAAGGHAGSIPSLARSVGCRVSDDRYSVTLLFASAPAAALLDDIRRSAAIAVAFSQPSTHRTLQLKGSDARVVAPKVADQALIRNYRDAFILELAPLGHQAPFVRTLLAHDPDDVVAVEFTPSSAFSQTPGPHAGVPLASLQGREIPPPEGRTAKAA